MTIVFISLCVSLSLSLSVVSPSLSYLSRSLSPFSQNYHLQTSRDMHPHHRSMALEPSTNYKSQQPPLPAAQFRSRNQSYMRAVSTLSQASCVSQVSQVSIWPITMICPGYCHCLMSDIAAAVCPDSGSCQWISRSFSLPLFNAVFNLP